MSDWELYTQLFTSNWRCGRFVQSLSQGCTEKIRKKDVFMTAGRWSSWPIQILQFLMLWWPALKAGSIAMTQRPRDRVPSGSMMALPDPRRPDRANPPTNFWWSFFLACTGFPQSTDSQQGILCWGFKRVQKEIPSEEASTLQIRAVAFPPGQCTSPQLYPCHRLFDQDGHQDSSSASLESRPCSLWLCLFPKLKQNLRGCHYEIIEEMKEAVMKVIDTLTQEDFHGAFQSLLERYKCIAAGGDYFEGD